MNRNTKLKNIILRHFALLISLLLLTSASLSDTLEYIRDYTYIAEEYDNKTTARQMAIQEVRRDLLNEIGTHVYSRIDIIES